MKNNYIVDGDVVKVYFRTKKGFFIIDKADLEKVSECTWYLNATGYPSTRIKGKHTTLHRYLMGKNPEGYVVDHINRDKTDNRRCNLRFCTPLENNHNRSNIVRGGNYKSYQNTMRGIRCREGKRGKTYKVETHDINNKTIYLGSYKTLEKAVEVRNTAFLLHEQGKLNPFDIYKPLMSRE